MTAAEETKRPTILVSTDGSATSLAAARQAAELARATGARFLGLYVIDSHAAVYLGVYYSRAIEEMEVEGQKALAALQSVAREVDVPIETILATGNPRHDILDVAEKQGVTLLVVGSHGHTGLERALMGSVSEYIVRHARMSVLVVRPDRAAATPQH